MILINENRKKQLTTFCKLLLYPLNIKRLESLYRGVFVSFIGSSEYIVELLS